MNRVALLASSFFLALTAYGCSGDCNRASDCAAAEVCHLGACVASTAQPTTCTTDMECNEGLPQALFSCNAGRCRRMGGAVITPDSGPAPDLGPQPDTGPADTGLPDTGPADTGLPDTGTSSDAGSID